jgi:hypothetical protein
MKNFDIGSGGSGPPFYCALRESKTAEGKRNARVSLKLGSTAKLWLFLKYDSFTLHVLQDGYSSVNF